jgi:hypothetical protein
MISGTDGHASVAASQWYHEDDAPPRDRKEDAPARQGGALENMIELLLI